MIFHIDDPLVSTDKESDAYLKINNCGQSRSGERDYIVSRPLGRHDYQLIYTVSGYITICDQTSDIHLTSGNAYLFLPGQPQKYVFESSAMAHAHWVHFTGTSVPFILRDAGISTEKSALIGLSNSSEVASLFRRLQLERRINHVTGTAVCNGLLIQILGILSAGYRAAYDHTSLGYTAVSPLSKTIGNIHTPENLQFIYNLIQAIDNDCSLPLNIDDTAADCGLSRDRFVHIFKDTVGIPPHTYLLRVRLEKAAHLLTCTNMTISEVASAVGFDDSLYFSRLFHRQIGESPSEFRSCNR